MRIFSVSIEGTKAILLHNPAGMGRSFKAGKAGEKSIPTAEEEAAASCYWTEDRTSLGFPSINLQSALISASTAYKAPKKIKLTPFVAGSVEIDPDIIPFGTDQYEIDTRRAVIQRQGILRSRARIPAGWVLSFNMLVDDDFPLRDLEILRDMLAEAGRRIGIGDFRPQKRGPFGKFKVVQFHEQQV